MGRSLRRSPVLHFLLLGGLLYCAKTLAPDLWQPDPEVIAVDAADIEGLRAAWLRDSGRLPTDAEIKASLNSFLDEEVLVREGLRLGLDQRDAVVRRRLLMNMHFAFPESGDSDDSLLREARRLQMNTRDLVARRRLIHLMEQRLTDQAGIDEAALRDYLARHPQLYARPARRGFRQVFFDGGRVDSGARAEAQLAQLNKHPQLWPEGDPFLLGSTFSPRSAAEITTALGAEVSAAVMRARAHEWVGPVHSPYGVHLIRVDVSEPAQPAALTTVRSQVIYALRHEREQQTLKAELLALRERYPVSLAAAKLRP